MQLFLQTYLQSPKNRPASFVQRTLEIPVFLQLRKIECKYSDSLRIKKHCDTFFLQKVKKNAFSATPIYIINMTNFISSQSHRLKSRLPHPVVKVSTPSLSLLTDSDGASIIGWMMSMERAQYLRPYPPHTNYASATNSYFGAINRETKRIALYFRNGPYADIREYYDKASAQVQPLSSIYARAEFPTQHVLSASESH